MGLETATYISGLNPSNPIDASDVVGQGDDHIRLIKAVTLNTWPNITGAVTLSHTQINELPREDTANTWTEDNDFQALTCTRFTSTGIDDNATQERLEVSDSSLVYRGDNNVVTLSETSLTFYRASGSYIDNLGVGADTIFRTSNVGDRDKTPLTLKANGNAEFSGAVACGAFTSKGIDDNATEEALQITDAGIVVGATSADYSTSISRSITDQGIAIAGGTSFATGGWLDIKGGAHTSQAFDLSYWADSSLKLRYDHSASSWDFQSTYISTNASIYAKGGNVYVGVGDTTPGFLHVYGQGAGGLEGGEIRLYTAADYDATYDYFYIDVREEKLRIGPASGTAAEFVPATSLWDFRGNALLFGNHGKLLGFGTSAIFQVSNGAGSYTNALVAERTGATTLYYNGAAAIATTSGGGMSVAGASVFGDTIRPATDNVDSVGTIGFRWTTIYATNGTINTSDERLKDYNSLSAFDAVRAVRDLSFIRYTWKDGEDKAEHLGVSAQQVERVLGAYRLPDGMVDYDAEADRYGFHYHELIPLLGAALQHTIKRLDRMEYPY